jgi:hypothetical protein
MKRHAFVCSVFVYLSALNIFAQPALQTEFWGEITGRVLNENGQPVAKAKVCAAPSPRAWLGEIPCESSKSDGTFTIHLMGAFECVITAEKERDGYPNTLNSFYGSTATPLPTVVLDERRKKQDITVYVGPAFGMLNVKLRDAETDRPIESVMMELHHANNPANTISRSTGFPKGRLQLPFRRFQSFSKSRPLAIRSGGAGRMVRRSAPRPCIWRTAQRVSW